MRGLLRRKNFGSVFKLSAGGKETILHSFHNDDGAQPSYEIMRDTSGDLYGTTMIGGYNQNGTVFKMHGTRFSLLRKFQGSPDGANPGSVAKLMQAAAPNGSGSLYYGTTVLGGTGPCAGGCGTIFKIDRFGHEAVLHRFTGPDGAFPDSGLVGDGKGYTASPTTEAPTVNRRLGVVERFMR